MSGVLPPGLELALNPSDGKRGIQIPILYISKSLQLNHVSLAAEMWHNKISAPKIRAQSTRPLIMQRTAASFLLPFQISGFTERLQRAEFGTWLCWRKGAFVLCPCSLLPRKFVLIPGSTQVDPVVMSADQCLQETSGPGQTFSISQNLGAAWCRCSFVLFVPHWKSWLKPCSAPVPLAWELERREQVLVLLSWVLLEAILLQNKLVLCVPVIPGPWQIAETSRNSANPSNASLAALKHLSLSDNQTQNQPCFPLLQSRGG